MELEEAKEIIDDCIEWDTFGRSVRSKKNKLDNKCFKALEIVMKEYNRLQKENTMLENTKNNCPHFNTSGISCDKKFCNLDDYISKNEIKDCLDDIENYFENVSVPYEDIEFIKEKRKDLLKEE